MENCYTMKDVLEAIHSLIKINGFKLDNDVISEVDLQVQDYIKSKVNIIEAKKSNLKYKDINIKKSVLADLSLYYFAVVNDNLRLFELLKQRGLKFVYDYKVLFYVLDKDFSSKFSFNKYIDLILNHEIVFRRFYSGLRGLDKEDYDKYTNDFSEIISSKPNICVDSSRNDSYDNCHLSNLLSIRNIGFFGKDFILNSNLKQRRIIDSLDGYLTDEQLKKVFELLKTYPNYDCKISLTSELLNELSIDEIAGLSDKDVFLYSKAMIKSRHLVGRVHNVLLLNPNFSCSEEFIKPEIFKSLSDEVIAGLTSAAIEEIGSIKIPYIDNVYVMPIRKINRIVAKDERLKKKLEMQEAKKHK